MNNNKLKTFLVQDYEESNKPFLQKSSCFKFVKKYSSIEKALPQIIKQKPEAIFLNVERSGECVHEFIEKLHNESIYPLFIITTAFDQKAAHDIRNASIEYLINQSESLITKNNDEDLLKSEPNKASLNNKTNTLQHDILRIRLNTHNGFIMINPTDILYIKADWNYSDIYFVNKKHETISSNIGSIEKLLSKNQFFRINRSIIINLDYLIKVNRKTKKCIINHFGKEKEFCIPTRRIREMEKIF